MLRKQQPRQLLPSDGKQCDPAAAQCAFMVKRVFYVCFRDSERSLDPFRKCAAEGEFTLFECGGFSTALMAKADSKFKNGVAKPRKIKAYNCMKKDNIGFNS